MADGSDDRPTSYEDALRALGRYLDESHYFRFTVAELPDGFLVKGRCLLDRRSVSGARAVSRTLWLRQREMAALVSQARARRAAARAGVLRRLARARRGG